MRRSVTLVACGLVLLAGCVGVPQAGQTNTETPDSTPIPTGESSDKDSPNQIESSDSLPTVEHIGPYVPTEFDYSWTPPRHATVEEIVIGERATDDETRNSTTDEPQPHPHTYTIWNNDSTDHRVQINISRQANVIRNESYRVPKNGTVTITLAEPARYTTPIVVSEAGNITSELRITEDQNDFDCNAKGVQVAILRDGKTDATVSSTLVMCPGDE